MNIFTDYHHDDLLNSLHVLFESRLKMKLYRPIGLDWFNEGYWKIAEPYKNAKGTISQYLVNGSVPEDGTKPLNTDPRYYTGAKHKLLTLNQFKKKKIDVVIASYLPHVPVYKELIKKYQPEAKLIHQMGNDWSKIVNFNDVKNILASTSKFKVPDGVNVVFYHQEFDTKLFRYEPPEYTKKISSFVNVISSFPTDLRFIKGLKRKLRTKKWKIKLYGSSCPDGVVQGHRNIVSEMHSSMFGLHLKRGGDGFGHIIHNWFACGRPPIVRYSQYKNQVAGDLMEDGKTAIFVDGLTPRKVARKILKYSKPDIHNKMCLAAHRRFGEVVNYDKEQKDIVKFLERLV